MLDINEGSVRLAIDAPKAIPILRSELLQAADANRDSALAGQSSSRDLLRLLEGTPGTQSAPAKPARPRNVRPAAPEPSEPVRTAAAEPPEPVQAVESDAPAAQAPNSTT